MVRGNLSDSLLGVSEGGGTLAWELPIQVLAMPVAFAIALLSTPLILRLAIRIGLVDHPDPNRKLHRGPVPVAGGIVVLIATLLAVLWGLGASGDLLDQVWQQPKAMWALAVCSLLIVLLGMQDDFHALSGPRKLLGQICISGLLVAAGFQMSVVNVLGWDIDLGLLSVPLSILWILLTINAINLIDGADGLASTVGWIAAAALGSMALMTGKPADALICSSLAGALLGFLIHNFPPAKIFLGDSGSMLVGLLLGAIGLRSSLKEATAFSVLVPVAVLSLPLFDSAMAIIRRKLTGRSIFTGDRGHIHHNLMRVGFSNRAMILLVTLMGGLVAMAACLGVALGNDFIPVVAMAAILSCLIFARWFGYVELRLLVNKLKHLLERVLPQGWISPNAPHQAMVILQGHRNWDRIWKSLVELALQRQLLKVCMDVNVPWLHEGFHANWERASELPADQRWVTRFPIIAQGRLVGRLDVSGALDDSSYLMTLGMLGGLLQNLAPQIEALVNEGNVAVRTHSPGEPSRPDVVASGPLI